MSGVKWPVVIEDAEGDAIRVKPGRHFMVVTIKSARALASVALTPAQSATLRAALEAAEKEMS